MGLFNLKKLYHLYEAYIYDRHELVNADRYLFYAVSERKKLNAKCQDLDTSSIYSTLLTIFKDKLISVQNKFREIVISRFSLTLENNHKMMDINISCTLHSLIHMAV